jgi:hypothetical protein
MSFDLDEWSAEIGASRSGESAIDEMASEADRIRAHIESRRGLMQRQTASDDIKSKLCDKIQGLKREVPGLATRIYAIEDDDPELFKYIRNLEFINQGIWCPRCNIQKSIGKRPEPEVEAEPVITPSAEELRCAKVKSEQAKLQAELDQVIKNMTALQHKFDASIAELTANANDLMARINRLDKALTDRAEPAVKPIDELPVKALPITTWVQSINDTVKKEDLPSKPMFEWDREVSHMSSDDLLG